MSVLCVRVKILEQFVETVNQLKGQRQQTIQTHLCAALCSLLKVLQLRNPCVSSRKPVLMKTLMFK